MHKFKKNPKTIIVDLFLAILSIFLIVIMLYPMLYEVFISLSDPKQLAMQYGLIWHPAGFSLIGYRLLFKVEGLMRGLWNTIYIMFWAILGQMTITGVGAYFLSRSGSKVKWRKVVVIIILITQYFGGTLISNWLLIRNLGLYNNRWSLIAPGLVSMGNMILMNAYFRSIPEEMEEATRMDGGGHLTVLFRVLIPLAKPALMVILLYTVTDVWNGWFNAKIYLTSKDLYPLQLVLRNLISSEGADVMGSGQTLAMGIDEYTLEVLKAALVIFGSLPPLILYPFLQKHLRGGLMIGSLKG